MLKKLLKNLLGNHSSSHKHRKYSSSDYKHRRKYSSSNRYGHSHYGSSHYKRKRSSL
ncbi:hypothetical protein PMI05_04841, partial [Brevibacillus sp. BC25]